MNVLFYVIDALRADHLSCYGYERETSPTMDALAEDGVRFEQCFTPATWTRPVAATLSTGLYPPAHGTRTRHDTLTTATDTLAERFRAAGYDTVGITSMGNVSSATGFDRGFDRFFDLYKDDDILDKRGVSTATDEELLSEEGVVALPRAEDISETFTQWLDGRDGESPFFAFCWSIEPHIPYDPPPGYDMFRDPEYAGSVDGSRESLTDVESDADRAALQARYDEEIRYNDDCLGTMIDALRESGALDDTLVCVVGDHGDAFNEHGRLTHGHAPYDELTHVPWIMRPPEAPETQVVTGLHSLVDVYPTLLAAADVDTPEYPQTVSGRSCAPVLEGQSVPARETVYFETQSYDMQNAFYGLRTAEWKYMRIEQPEMSASTAFGLIEYVFRKGILTDILRNPRHYWNRYRYDDRQRLYALDDDPDEQRNLAEDNPAVRDNFGEAVDTWLAACRDFAEKDDERQVTIDAETKSQLRELGYTE